MLGICDVQNAFNKDFPWHIWTSLYHTWFCVSSKRYNFYKNPIAAGCYCGESFEALKSVECWVLSILIPCWWSLDRGWERHRLWEPEEVHQRVSLVPHPWSLTTCSCSRRQRAGPRISLHADPVCGQNGRTGSFKNHTLIKDKLVPVVTMIKTYYR